MRKLNGLKCALLQFIKMILYQTQFLLILITFVKKNGCIADIFNDN